MMSTNQPTNGFWRDPDFWGYFSPPIVGIVFGIAIGIVIGALWGMG